MEIAGPILSGIATKAAKSAANRLVRAVTEKKPKKANPSKKLTSDVKDIMKRCEETKKLFDPGDETFSGFIGFGTAAQWENYDNLATHSFSNIASGSGLNQRIGDRITPSRLKIGMQIFTEAGNASSVTALDAPYWRLLICQLKRGVLPNDLPNYMNSNSYGFMTDISQDPNVTSRVYILKDTKIRVDRQVSANGVPGGTEGYFMAPHHIQKTFIVKPKISCTWQPTTLTAVPPDIKGAICMYLYYNNTNVVMSTTPRQGFYKAGYSLTYKDC